MQLLHGIPISPSLGWQCFEDEAIEQSIPQRFEQQVRVHAARPALRWDRGSHDYASLNEAANRLARALLARGAAPTEPVALLFEHGGEALVAILAVLKAGKFYVVLDPGYPPDRLKYILDDSGATLMVADVHNFQYARQLCADRIEPLNFGEVDQGLPGGNLAVYPAPSDLAMLLYTSGSTGRPKGVMHSHRNVLVDVRNFTNGWGITAHDRWLLATSIGFANSVRTIYGALLNGAAIYPFDVKRNGFVRLAAWMLDNELTIVRNVPTFFRNFATTLRRDQTFPVLRVLSLGGEPMLREDLVSFNRHFSPHCVLSHAFGPTECLTVCWALIPHGATTTDSKLPIGHSLRDKDVLLLDEERREVVYGEVGEIAVRSRHISAGYWRDPERTRAAFLPDPEGSEARIYLTGDFGRRAPDGSVIHVGRRDFQVKVRGFRIDVSEIECALCAMAGISDAVVVGREVDPGEQQLVAYFVASPDSPISASTLRKQLARVLPDYMIPSAFVAMDALPQTPNGKTDRLRLPPPPRDRRDPGVLLTAPRSAIETELAAMWAQVLGLDQVGAMDRFLDLGGDSLQASMITARAAARFNVEVPIDVLFDPGTIAHMAQVVAAGLADAESAGTLAPTPLASIARGKA